MNTKEKTVDYADLTKLTPRELVTLSGSTNLTATSIEKLSDKALLAASQALSMYKDCEKPINTVLKMKDDEKVVMGFLAILPVVAAGVLFSYASILTAVLCMPAIVLATGWAMREMGKDFDGAKGYNRHCFYLVQTFCKESGIAQDKVTKMDLMLAAWLYFLKWGPQYIKQESIRAEKQAQEYHRSLHRYLPKTRSKNKAARQDTSADHFHDDEELVKANGSLNSFGAGFGAGAFGYAVGPGTGFDINGVPTIGPDIHQ